MKLAGGLKAWRGYISLFSVLLFNVYFEKLLCIFYVVHLFVYYFDNMSINVMSVNKRFDNLSKIFHCTPKKVQNISTKTKHYGQREK